jgi:hypothetical protein
LRQVLLWAGVGSGVAAFLQLHPDVGAPHVGPLGVVLGAGAAWIGVLILLGRAVPRGAGEVSSSPLDWMLIGGIVTGAAMGLLWLFGGAGAFRVRHGSLNWTSGLQDTLTIAVFAAVVTSGAGAIISSVARVLWQGRKEQRIAVLLELISVVIWFQLAGRFGDDACFMALAGLVFSLFGGGVGFWIGAPFIWRQPEREYRFWSMFCVMMGGLGGMSLCTCLALPMMRAR